MFNQQELVTITYQDEHNTSLGNTKIPHSIASLCGYVTTAIQTDVSKQTNMADNTVILITTQDEYRQYDRTLHILAGREPYPKDEKDFDTIFLERTNYLLINEKLALFIQKINKPKAYIRFLVKQAKNNQQAILSWLETIDLKNRLINDLYSQMYTSYSWRMKCTEAYRSKKLFNKLIRFKTSEESSAALIHYWRTQDPYAKLFSQLISSEMSFKNFDPYVAPDLKNSFEPVDKDNVLPRKYVDKTEPVAITSIHDLDEYSSWIKYLQKYYSRDGGYYWSEYIALPNEAKHIHAPLLREIYFEYSFNRQFIVVDDNKTISQLNIVDINHGKLFIKNCPNIRFDATELQNMPFIKLKKKQIHGNFEKEIPQIHIENCPSLIQDFMMIGESSDYNIIKSDSYQAGFDYNAPPKINSEYEVQKWLIYKKITLLDYFYYVMLNIKQSISQNPWVIAVVPAIILWDIFNALPGRFEKHGTLFILQAFPNLIDSQVFIYKKKE